MHAQVWLVAGYAGLILAAAGALERLARHTAARSERYRTAGFTYHPRHDLWMCPRDEPLWPAEVDRRHRLIRYRGRPGVCNACPVKADCTTSHAGREVVRPIDPWPHSEAGRFHRGVSVTLSAVAAAFPLTATAAYHRPGDLAVLGPAAALAGWLLWRWAGDLRRTPSGFPEVATVRHDRRTTAPHGPDPAAPTRQRPGRAWGFDRHRSGSGYRSVRAARARDRKDRP
ncbi:hypothetical protein [Actinoplanes teichomyceticus]|uniref:Transposase DDE domain-containing protein n=1 Tax=Actinoplanes teichomyceticus TaxID=1867 RepID=A0A561WMG4_ACTTI|nr:hypothetical protein [Actinoplanes teichomyceticus]TWG25051.1 hypothetical protein FHX34_10110 [Actinoplanes teichomyceticus]GIF10121.1 hypothetical protein Ate01nite_01530 [Actinoplanes teichomyceticus]